MGAKLVVAKHVRSTRNSGFMSGLAAASLGCSSATWPSINGPLGTFMFTLPKARSPCCLCWLCSGLASRSSVKSSATNEFFRGSLPYGRIKTHAGKGPERTRLFQVNCAMIYVDPDVKAFRDDDCFTRTDKCRGHCATHSSGAEYVHPFLR